MAVAFLPITLWDSWVSCSNYMNTGKIIKKKMDLPYTQIPNEMLRNPNISSKAKGLLCFLLSLPEDWVIYKSNLHEYFTDGKDSIRSSWTELEALGYVTSTQMTNETGNFCGWEHVVYYEPITPSNDGITDSGKSHIGDAHLYKERKFNKERILPSTLKIKEIPQTPASPPTGVNYQEGGGQNPKSKIEEGLKFAEWFQKELCPEHIKPTTQMKAKWATIYERLIRIDSKTKEQVIEAVKWARNNDFWKSNFMTPMKLRDKNKDGIMYIDYFLNRCNEEKNVKKTNKPTYTPPADYNPRKSL